MKDNIIFAMNSIKMKIQEIISILEQWAPKAYAEDFDNVGLLVSPVVKLKAVVELIPA